MLRENSVRPLLGTSKPCLNVYLIDLIDLKLHLVGFEPTTSYEADYESDAFDHLATDAYDLNRWSWWDLNPRPFKYQCYFVPNVKLKYTNVSKLYKFFKFNLRFTIKIS